MERKLSCNFFGHLRDEETACVSVTGCPGDDMFFTINSKNSGARNMFILHKDGSVQGVESAFKVNLNYNLCVLRIERFSGKQLIS